MDVVLIGGLWLDVTAWDETVAELERLGHRALPVALPGQGSGQRDASLDDQLAAVLGAVDEAENPLVVGHSAACSLAWLAADRRAEAVGRVALIGGFPVADGEQYAAFFDLVDGVMPFPGWEPFEGPDSEDLSEEQRRAIADSSHAVPGRVAHGVVSLHDERRYGVPTTLVCPEFSPAQAQEWVDSGETPELARIDRLSMVDIDSGHWPMYSRPAELARLLGSLTP